MMEEKTISVPGRNLGDYVKEAALVAGIIGGIATSGAFSKPDDVDRPVIIKNPTRRFAEAIMADRLRAERMR